ncbi:ABC transporter permease [Pseudovibrio brasiliensis]|uniref:FtsX-like permease family protein n=1 Tax=Pseudovibrio brasiliensis TaxID=1898042 RepID=A0ABX8AZU7_9HYPH|nr:FtsX-like permease family protein [Pseudovibrio brasiliensis]QUS59161.1 FtsX-like permease family protein [Pseudovibrio brasiliensis]
MTVLNRKLLRDLYGIKGQACAVLLVVATGVALTVLMGGVYQSLLQAQATYYEQNNFADIYVELSRAPNAELAKVTDIEGVFEAESRIAGSAQLLINGQALSIRTQTLSLPKGQLPRINRPDLVVGRLPDPARPNEILLLASFASKHGLSPGTSISAIINGSYRDLMITGLARSPEFIYAIPPNSVVADSALFGVIWMNQSAMEAVYDLDGGFNQVLLTKTKQREIGDILARLDTVTSAFGGRGAHSALHRNATRLVSSELTAMKASGRVAPVIFLGVATFLLYLVLARILDAERRQIGILRAMGFSNIAVLRHYMKLVFVIAWGGSVLGCLSGLLMQLFMLGKYLEYFNFSHIDFIVDGNSIALGFIASTLSACVSGALAMSKLSQLSVSQTMQPPTPPVYESPGVFRGWLLVRLDQSAKMIFRRLQREPKRLLGSVLGIAFGMSLSVAANTLLVSFQETLRVNYGFIERSDVTVSFVEPLPLSAVNELRSLDHIIDVEPFLFVNAVLTNVNASYRRGLFALVDDPHLKRAVTSEQQVLSIPENGAILAQSLAFGLGVDVGDTITAQIKEGRQPQVDLTVVAIMQNLLGAPAYVNLKNLNEIMRWDTRVSAVNMRIDEKHSKKLFQILNQMPKVAQVTLKSQERRSFQSMMDKGTGMVRFIIVAIAGIITICITYCFGLIAFAERRHDLATLYTMGFTKAELDFVLFGEVALVTLMALPIGSFAGYFLSFHLAASFSTDIYQVPVSFTSSSYGLAALSVLISAYASCWLVRRRALREDTIKLLKFDG